MSSPPVSDSSEPRTMSDNKQQRDTATATATVPPHKEDDTQRESSRVQSSTITPNDSTDDETYDSRKSQGQENDDATAGPPPSPKDSIPRMSVIPYTDRSNAIIENLTDSDKKILRLYEENAVIGGPFPVKLQIILKVTEILGQQHIISWLPHGRSFMIHRPREFEEKIMGEFFKQTKLSSFKRQLNLYDFQRVTRGTDCGSYYHEMFLRGKPLLAKRMIRRKIKGTKNLTSSTTAATCSTGDDQDHVPDFYSMPFVGTNRSGLDLQQATRLMNRNSSIPGMNFPRQSMPGTNLGAGGSGMGPVGDMNASHYAHRLHGSGVGHHLGAAGLVPPTSGAYDSLLNASAASINPGALGGLSSHSAALHQHNSHDLPLSSLHQLQLKSELMNPAAQLSMQSSYPQQIHSHYAAAMENLNNSYALAATALKRDLDSASTMMTQEDLVAARHFNRQGGALSNSYNFNSKGW